MKTIPQLKSEINSTKLAITPLATRLDSLRRELAEAESRQFIEANTITREDVQMSSGDEMPWHGSAWEFAEWMRANKVTKKWCEWNGIIYHVSDILNSRMSSTPGRTEHL